MKRCLVSLCLMVLPLQGIWNPSVLTDEVEILQDPAFVCFQQNILQQVQNTWCSEEKAKLLTDLVALCRPRYSVEIGVFAGDSLFPLATAVQHFQCGTVVGIDAWSNEEATRGCPQDDPHVRWWTYVDMQSAKQRSEALLDNYHLRLYCSLLQMPSRDAVFEQKIDFLHLDGSFLAEDALADVQQFLPQVAPGGHILISNVRMKIADDFPRIDAIVALLNSCDFVAEIECGNAILFRQQDRKSSASGLSPCQIHYIPDLVARFYLDDAQDVIKDHARCGMYWGSKTGELIQHYAKRNSTTVNVGAHIGLQTVMMSRTVGKKGHVYAFEPNQKLFTEHLANLRLNNCSNVTSLQMDLGKKISLDSLNLANVSMIRVALQRSEYLPFFLGAKETILCSRPVIVFEDLNGYGYGSAMRTIREEWEHIFDLIRSYGYSVLGNDPAVHRADAGAYLCAPVEKR